MDDKNQAAPDSVAAKSTRVAVRAGEMTRHARSDCKICYGTGIHTYVDHGQVVCPAARARFLKANPSVTFDESDGNFYWPEKR